MIPDGLGALLTEDSDEVPLCMKSSTPPVSLILTATANQSDRETVAQWAASQIMAGYEIEVTGNPTDGIKGVAY